MSIRISTVMIRFLGRCPKPQFLFCLPARRAWQAGTQKRNQKKVKAEPASYAKR